MKLSRLTTVCLFLFAVALWSTAMNTVIFGLPVSQVFGIKNTNGSDQNWPGFSAQTDDGLRLRLVTGTGLTQWDGDNGNKYATPNNTVSRYNWRLG